MPSTDRKLELKANDINVSDRLTGGCVRTDLSSSVTSQAAVYAKGLIKKHRSQLGFVTYLLT
jgi:hypothetical protein